MEFLGKKVLLKYKCGSHLFKLDDANSDEDYVFVLDGFSGYVSDKIDGIDCFIFGVDAFRKKMTFSRKVLDYMVVFNLDIFKMKDNLVYIDDSFKDEFDSLLKVDWDKALNPFLISVVDYFSRYLNFELKKQMYHLYLIDEFVRKYKITGKFEYPTNELVFKKARKFKEDSDKQKAIYFKDFKKIIQFLKSCIDEVK